MKYKPEFRDILYISGEVQHRSCAHCNKTLERDADHCPECVQEAEDYSVYGMRIMNKQQALALIMDNTFYSNGHSRADLKRQAEECQVNMGFIGAALCIYFKIEHSDFMEYIQALKKYP